MVLTWLRGEDKSAQTLFTSAYGTLYHSNEASLGSKQNVSVQALRPWTAGALHGYSGLKACQYGKFGSKMGTGMSILSSAITIAQEIELHRNQPMPKNICAFAVEHILLPNASLTNTKSTMQCSIQPTTPHPSRSPTPIHSG
jgi:hypothetical protein